MLRFITYAAKITGEVAEFQYISCYGLSEDSHLYEIGTV